MLIQVLENGQSDAVRIMKFSGYKKKAITFLIVLLLCAWFQILAADEPDETGLSVQIDSGSVTLDERKQAASGLKTAIVANVRYQAESEVIGKVVSIEPLLTLRERYWVARAELSGANAKLKLAEQNLHRQQDLFRNGVVAKRDTQALEAQVLSEQAVVDAGQAHLVKIENETRLLWGDKLAELALTGRKQDLAGFLSGQQKLLQITLPGNTSLYDNINTIAVEPYGVRSRAYPAELLSRSAQADNTVPGESYFFLSNAAQLKIGMKINAWIAQTAQEQQGAWVPDSAVVWHMNQEFVYVKAADDRFSRRPIKSYLKSGKGYFIKDGLGEGEEVVISGGQMLLSEEFKGQIPDED